MPGLFEEFVRRADFEIQAETAHDLCQLRLASRHFDPLDAARFLLRAGQAQQQFRARGQWQNVEHRRLLRQVLHIALFRAKEVHAVILKIILQLRRLQRLRSRTRFAENGLKLPRVFDSVRTLEQQIREFVIHRADDLPVGRPRVAIAVPDRHVIANPLQRRHRAPVCLNRNIALTLTCKNAPRLPLPAIERIRRPHALRQLQCATCERQRFGQFFFKLVERTLMAERQ